MKYKNAESWKTHMLRIAKEKCKSPQDIQQRYILEEFAEKIGNSVYKDRLILKGGFVVSTLLGLDTRMTRDLDLTYSSNHYSENEIFNILLEVTNVSANGLFNFEIISIETSQIKIKHSGFLVKMCANFEKIKLDFKLDISNNTLIYPSAIENNLISMFNNEKIDIMSYPIENIIAEKFETTLDRGEANGRMRDVTDVFMLIQNQDKLIDYPLLIETILKVAEDRGTTENLYEYKEILDFLKHSEMFNLTFLNYITKANLQEISLSSCFQVFYKIGSDIYETIQRK